MGPSVVDLWCIRMSNEKHQCRYCAFKGRVEEWGRQPFIFWRMTLWDSLISRGKLEREYICPKCGHTKYIAEDSTNFKVAVFLFIVLTLFVVGAMLYFKLTE